MWGKHENYQINKWFSLKIGSMNATKNKNVLEKHKTIEVDFLGENV